MLPLWVGSVVLAREKEKWITAVIVLPYPIKQLASLKTCQVQQEKSNTQNDVIYTLWRCSSSKWIRHSNVLNFNMFSSYITNWEPGTEMVDQNQLEKRERDPDFSSASLDFLVFRFYWFFFFFFRFYWNSKTGLSSLHVPRILILFPVLFSHLLRLQLYFNGKTREIHVRWATKMVENYTLFSGKRIHYYLLLDLCIFISTNPPPVVYLKYQKSLLIKCSSSNHPLLFYFPVMKRDVFSYISLCCGSL